MADDDFSAQSALRAALQDFAGSLESAQYPGVNLPPEVERDLPHFKRVWTSLIPCLGGNLPREVAAAMMDQAVGHVEAITEQEPAIALHDLYPKMYRLLAVIARVDILDILTGTNHGADDTTYEQILVAQIRDLDAKISQLETELKLERDARIEVLHKYISDIRTPLISIDGFFSNNRVGAWLDNNIDLGDAGETLVSELAAGLRKLIQEAKDISLKNGSKNCLRAVKDSASEIFVEIATRFSNSKSLGKIASEFGSDSEDLDKLNDSFKVELLRIELGEDVVSIIKDGEHSLLSQIQTLRGQLVAEFGYLCPSVRVQDNTQISNNSYRIMVKDIEAGSGELRNDMLLLLDPHGEEIDLPGEKTNEPTFGLPAIWVDKKLRDDALSLGLTVVSPPTVVTTHLTEIIKRHLSELFSYADLQSLLNKLPEEERGLIDQIVPDRMSGVRMLRIFQNLLGERIPIRDLSTILEGISEASETFSNLTEITEQVRSRLSRQICELVSDNKSQVQAVTFGDEWYEKLNQIMSSLSEPAGADFGSEFMLDFRKKVGKTIHSQRMKGIAPVLLTRSNFRPFIQKILGRVEPITFVMSENEISPGFSVVSVGELTPPE